MQAAAAVAARIGWMPRRLKSICQYKVANAPPASQPMPRRGNISSPSRNLVGFDDYRDLPNVTRGLVDRGYGDDDIRAILGGNALRVFRSAW